MNRLFAGTAFDIPPQCEDCGKLESECICSPEAKRSAEVQRAVESARLPPEKQIARIGVEKRKGGRKATVISGLTHQANDLPELLAKLQNACGTGGTVKPKEDLIELQGDHRETARQTLAMIGFKVKLIGG